MYAELRTYDLRESRALAMGEDTDAGLMMRFIEAVLNDREYELDGMFALHCDIIVNDDKLLEDLSIPQVMSFLYDYFWSRRSIEMVTVHVMTCGKMTIACYNDDEGLISRIVIE